jgi:hypothetical protein
MSLQFSGSIGSCNHKIHSRWFPQPSKSLFIPCDFRIIPFNRQNLKPRALGCMKIRPTSRAETNCRGRREAFRSWVLLSRSYRALASEVSNSEGFCLDGELGAILLRAAMIARCRQGLLILRRLLLLPCREKGRRGEGWSSAKMSNSRLTTEKRRDTLTKSGHCAVAFVGSPIGRALA